MQIVSEFDVWTIPLTSMFDTSQKLVYLSIFFFNIISLSVSMQASFVSSKAKPQENSGEFASFVANNKAFSSSSACAVTLTSSTTILGAKITFINIGTADCTFNDSGGETLKLSDPFVIYSGSAQDIYYTGISGYEWCFV